MSKGWIGVDLDGTLAHYDTWKGPDHIGAPVKPMVDRVTAWLAAGKDVRIFTARVSSDGSKARDHEASQAREAIQKWCLQHIGIVLRITNVKDYSMEELYDDRAVQVIKNTGQLVGQSTRGLV